MVVYKGFGDGEVGEGKGLFSGPGLEALASSLSRALPASMKITGKGQIIVPLVGDGLQKHSIPA